MGAISFLAEFFGAASCGGGFGCAASPMPCMHTRNVVTLNVTIADTPFNYSAERNEILSDRPHHSKATRAEINRFGKAASTIRNTSGLV
jgi:hypothetical protein